MSEKLFNPRYFSGKEFEYWARTVSLKIGIDAPLTLEEVGEQSLVPIMSKLRDLERLIDGLERKLTASRATNNELLRRIDDLERSI